MNTRSASAFLVIGLVMWIMPSVAPALFPRTGIDGSSARALWLQLMAVVHVFFGGTYLLQTEVVPSFVRWLAAEPAPQPVWEPVPANVLPFFEVATGEAVAEQGIPVLAAFEPAQVVTLTGKHPTLWRTLKQAFVDEERFAHFLERFRLLAQRYSTRAPVSRHGHVVFDHDAEHALVYLMQNSGINLDLLERRSRNWFGKVTAGSFLREAADEIGQVMGNGRRAA